MPALKLTSTNRSLARSWQNSMKPQVLPSRSTRPAFSGSAREMSQHALAPNAHTPFSSAESPWLSTASSLWSGLRRDSRQPPLPLSLPLLDISIVQYGADPGCSPSHMQWTTSSSWATRTSVNRVYTPREINIAVFVEKCLCRCDPENVWITN